MPPYRTLDGIEESIPFQANGLKLANVGTLGIAEGMGNCDIAYDRGHEVFQVGNLGRGAEMLREAPRSGRSPPAGSWSSKQTEPGADHLSAQLRPALLPDAPPKARRIAEQIEADIIEIMNTVKQGGF